MKIKPLFFAVLGLLSNGFSDGVDYGLKVNLVEIIVNTDGQQNASAVYVYLEPDRMYSYYINQQGNSLEDAKALYSALLAAKSSDQLVNIRYKGNQRSENNNNIQFYGVGVRD